MRKMKILLLRHGETKGNLERRYVGSTDEDLTVEAVKKLECKREALKKYLFSEMPFEAVKDKQWSEHIKIHVSPLKRATQTADILFEGLTKTVVEGFRECDFGSFEYKNYEELNGNAEYQCFIDTQGESGFPGGETKRAFIERTTETFRDIIEEAALDEKTDIIVVIAHGGTLMAVMDAFSEPHRDYYSWQTGCGQGFIAEIELLGARLRIIKIKDLK